MTSGPDACKQTIDVEIEEAWAAEVERRIAEVECGAVQVIPMAEALARVRASLDRSGLPPGD